MEPAESEAEAEPEDVSADAEQEPAAEEEPATPVKSFGEPDDDAEVLDEESSDPEIQLDLARAYISMGDKEAARVPIHLQGDVPSPAAPPPGCRFHPRCPFAQGRCRNEVPPVTELDPQHWLTCHYPVEAGHAAA